MITVASTTVKTRIIMGRSIIIMNRRFSLSRCLGSKLLFQQTGLLVLVLFHSLDHIRIIVI